MDNKHFKLISHAEHYLTPEQQGRSLGTVLAGEYRDNPVIDNAIVSNAIYRLMAHSDGARMEILRATADLIRMYVQHMRAEEMPDPMILGCVRALQYNAEDFDKKWAAIEAAAKEQPSAEG